MQHGKCACGSDLEQHSIVVRSSAARSAVEIAITAYGELGDRVITVRAYELVKQAECACRRHGIDCARASAGHLRRRSIEEAAGRLNGSRGRPISVRSADTGDLS